MIGRLMDWCVPAPALNWTRIANAPRGACPRCHGRYMRGHAHNEPDGRTCVACGWVRYWDPETATLYDAHRQPPWWGRRALAILGQHR